MLFKPFSPFCSIFYALHNLRDYLSLAFRGDFMYLYQRLRELRKETDKPQEELAEVLGISRQHYALYESGKREIPLHHFITLADFYGVSLDYIAGRSDSRN